MIMVIGRLKAAAYAARMRGAVGFALVWCWADVASAIPAFARRHEVSCSTCHQDRYPQLNAFGRRFQGDGYQLPDGAEDVARARRAVEPGTVDELLTLFKEVPLSLRAQALGVVPVDANEQDRSVFDTRLFAYLMGGGAVAEDVSFFFSWTPFPTSQLHHGHIGVHNLFDGVFGDGGLSLRAGMLFPLDFQRPSHRFFAPGGESAGGVVVGANSLTLDNANPAIEIYGRPAQGRFTYQVMALAGDTDAAGLDRDDWKNVFARATGTAWRNSRYEVTVGAFGMAGRSELPTSAGGVDLVIDDDVAIGGVDIEADVSTLTFFAMAYWRRDSDAFVEPAETTVWAGRGEVAWAPTAVLTASVRYEQVVSKARPELEAIQVVPQLTYEIATNALVQAALRLDIKEPSAGSSGLLLLDVTF